MSPEIIRDTAGVRKLAERLAAAPRVALDVESNGLFVYRPRLCTMQLAFEEAGELRVVIVDTLVTQAAPLAAVLGASGPIKVLHDLSFDARILSEEGVTLGNVRDTSVQARLLGRQQLGLGSLVEQELGIKLLKAFQQHNWAERPLQSAHLTYLADDVAHLFTLEEKLALEVAAHEITAEVTCETAYKLSEALTPPAPAPPAYLRIKGLDRLGPIEQAIVRQAFFTRDSAARAENVPAFKVAPNDFLLALAERKPGTGHAVRMLPGANKGRAARYADRWAMAVRQGLSDGKLPSEEAALLVPERLPPEQVKERRGREERLRSWRKRVAKERSVDEQAVLPGHCVSDLVSSAPTSLDGLRQIPGLGAFRVERDGRALLEAIHPALSRSVLDG